MKRKPKFINIFETQELSDEYNKNGKLIPDEIIKIYGKNDNKKDDIPIIYFEAIFLQGMSSLSVLIKDLLKFIDDLIEATNIRSLIETTGLASINQPIKLVPCLDGVNGDIYYVFYNITIYYDSDYVLINSYGDSYHSGIVVDYDLNLLSESYGILWKNYNNIIVVNLNPLNNGRWAIFDLQDILLYKIICSHLHSFPISIVGEMGLLGNIWPILTINLNNVSISDILATLDNPTTIDVPVSIINHDGTIGTYTLTSTHLLH